MTNLAAPIFDPDKWNVGSPEGVITAAVEEFCADKKIAIKMPILFHDFLRVMGMVEEVEKGKKPRLANQDVITVRYLSLNFNDASKVYSHIVPHIKGGLYRSNCYAYALNDPKPKSLPGRFDPGTRGRLNLDWDYLIQNDPADFKKGLMEGCRTDGLKYVGFEPNRLRGHYLIACYIGRDFNNHNSFHFVREDRDGGYSHKPGIKAVERTDFKGDVIIDPAKAVFNLRFITHEFVGYFLAR